MPRLLALYNVSIITILTLILKCGSPGHDEFPDSGRSLQPAQSHARAKHLGECGIGHHVTHVVRVSCPGDDGNNNTDMHNNHLFSTNTPMSGYLLYKQTRM